MEYKENSQKKVLLSVLGVAILVVAVIGVSFALYTYSFVSKDNQISTGTIMVSYSEPSKAINIDDAMPLDDDNGIALTGEGKSFDFTVSTKADNALTVPYEINLTRVAASTMANEQIKVYLVKGESAVLEPTLVDDLGDSTLRSGSKVLWSDKDVYTGENAEATTTRYTLKMWIDKDVDYDAVQGKEYKALVNVDSVVNALGVTD